jgi:hypothetical protein
MAEGPELPTHRIGSIRNDLISTKLGKIVSRRHNRGSGYRASPALARLYLAGLYADADEFRGQVNDPIGPRIGNVMNDDVALIERLKSA